MTNVRFTLTLDGLKINKESRTDGKGLKPLRNVLDQVSCVSTQNHNWVFGFFLPGTGQTATPYINTYLAAFTRSIRF